MFRRVCVVMCIVICTSAALAAGDNLNIRDYGARGDGKTRDTKAIQTAIDACSAAGGGTVTVPPGEYLSGQFSMKSGVILYLDAGATIHASADTLDYTRMRVGGDAQTHFILAKNASKFGIAGPGRILGNGTEYLQSDIRPDFRVGTIWFDNCRDVFLRDFTIEYSDTWTVVLLKCERVVVDGIAIRNNFYRINSDGIDPASCKDVFISNCSFVCGDDAICLKTLKPDEPCENIVVTNCTIETLTSGIKIGTGTPGDFRDIHFSNISIRNTGCCIGFFIKDGGTAERITFTDISLSTPTDLEKAGERRHTIIPVYIDIEQRKPESPIGRVRDITFTGITAVTDRGFLLQGMPERALEHITFRDITIRATRAEPYDERIKRGGGISNMNDERRTKYIRQPSWFAFAHVKDFTVDNLRVIVPPEVQDKFPRTALSVFEAENGVITNVARVSGGRVSPEPVVRLHNTRGVLLTGSRLKPGTGAVVGLSGEKTADISLQANDLHGTLKPWTASKDVPKGAVR